MSDECQNYSYVLIGEMAERLAASPNPLRRAMAPKVQLLANAMHDIEWVDDGDFREGADKKSIINFLMYHDDESVKSEIKAEIEAIAAQAIKRIQTLSGLTDKTTSKTEVQIICNCPDKSNFADEVVNVILSRMRDSGLGNK